MATALCSICPLYVVLLKWPVEVVVPGMMYFGVMSALVAQYAWVTHDALRSFFVARWEGWGWGMCYFAMQAAARYMATSCVHKR